MYVFELNINEMKKKLSWVDLWGSYIGKMGNRAILLLAAVLLIMPEIGFGQAPNLGTTKSFVLFTGVGAITNGATPIYLTHLTGNLGSNSGAATGFGNVDGVLYSGDATTSTATSDLSIANVMLDTTTANFHPASSNIGNGDTLLPGVYEYAGAATLNGILYLDAAGDPNAVFIFRFPGINTLDPSPNAKVKLINGAQACNVYWKVGGAFGSIAAGTSVSMKGTIVSNGAINLYSGDSLEGRALSTIGAISVLGTGGITAYTPIGCGSPVLTGPTAPSLGATKTYALFSSNGAVTNAGVSHILGDVGAMTAAPTGFGTAIINGSIHFADASATAASGDLSTLYNYLNTLSYDIELLRPDLFGHALVLTPHTYLLNAATTLTDSVILNAQGNPNAIFVFQIVGAFDPQTASKVKLINGTQAKNVYWVVTGATTVATNSVFNGSVIGGGGASAILLATGVIFSGRAMTTNGAVTINAATINADVLPAAGPITSFPDSTVCVGQTITVTGVDTGGTWSASNAHATVNTSGIVRGISAGLDTIRYIATNAFGIDTATTVIRVKPLPVAGPLTGLTSVCTDSSITISGVDTGGTFSRSNTHATISSGGVITGVTAGIDTFTYIVTNSCGSDTATKAITINGAPNARTITGPSTVCTGNTIALADTATGGTWSATNGHATVSSSGVVTGVSQGLDTIRYIVLGVCLRDTATKVITVNPSPNAGAITGASTVCTGGTINLTDGAIGGVWSATNTHATVLAGVVTGVTTGIDTIRYIVINSCGADTATKIITVNPSPNAGTITGGSVVCTGSTLTLADAVTGGVWSVSNGRATVSSSGLVTGISAGLDTISYAVTNTCGTATATKAITVVNTPNAGTITGAATVCVGDTATLTDAASGGVWSATNGRATVSSTGVVTGVSSGLDTIRYIVTTGCGADTATHIMTVNPLPNAGVITGASSVCVSSSILLSNTITGGAWTASNSNATVSGSGLVTGVTAGIDTITYTVTNTCGTDVAIKAITVNPTPTTAAITGASSVCLGSSITLADATAGGTWSATNGHATVVGGVVTSVTAGLDTIVYTVTYICGNAVATKEVAVNALPLLTSTTTPAAICDSDFFNYTPASDTASATFTWTRTTITGLSNGANSGSGNISESLVNITANPIVATYIYTTSANGCSTTQSVMVTVNPTPRLSSIMFDVVCSGSQYNYTATSATAGAAFTWTRATISGIFPVASSGTGNVHETLINSLSTPLNVAYVYTITANGCSFTQRVAVTVNPIPSAPSITINAPTNVCAGTMYQNFGTNTPLAGIHYYWSAVNAIVWATSPNGQNTLISFPTAGMAQVILWTNILGYPCKSSAIYTVNVSGTQAQVPVVSYFQYHFVSTPNDEGSYQWGYDDATTLDSTILPGEINQDYRIVSPDFAHRKYWVMTGTGGCLQKTYFSIPTAIENVAAIATTISIYPNPTNELINVSLNNTNGSAIVVEVMDMAGKLLISVPTKDDKTEINVSQLVPGVYMIGCYSNGIKIGTSRFVKE